MHHRKFEKTFTSPEIQQYLNDISPIPLLTPDEEITLAQRIKKGDHIALEQLTKANLRFVVSVAKQYQWRWLSLGDLINEGNIWILKAAQRFDETKWFKFISYAVWRIRQSILDAIHNHGQIVKTPPSKHNKQLETLYNTCMHTYEKEPSLEDFSIFVEDSWHAISAEEIEKFFWKQTKHLSLNKRIDEWTESEEFGDMLIWEDWRNYTLDRVTKQTLEDIVQTIFPWEEEYTPWQKRTIQTKKSELKDILQRHWWIGPYTASQDATTIAEAHEKSASYIHTKIQHIYTIMRRKQSMIEHIKESIDI